MVAELIAAGVLVVAAAAELVHARRVAAVAPLAFGANRRGRVLAAAAPLPRVLAFGAAGWGFTTLLLLPPASRKSGEVPPNEYRHLVLVLDVSPSMQLKDAGPGGNQTRAERAADVLQSFFERVRAERYKTTVVATYTEAKPVVVDTADREVVRNILTDLPMRHAFKAGETNLFAGLEEAAKIARPWPPGSAVLVALTDGDTVPASGMPRMPAAVGGNVVVVGVGNPVRPQSIGGHSSRQDVATLRQVAARLGGVYHDGNEKHLSTDLVTRVDRRAAPRDAGAWGKREYALLAAAAGSATAALLPVALTAVGTGWPPGRRRQG